VALQTVFRKSGTGGPIISPGYGRIASPWTTVGTAIFSMETQYQYQRSDAPPPGRGAAGLLTSGNYAAGDPKGLEATIAVAALVGGMSGDLISIKTVMAPASITNRCDQSLQRRKYVIKCDQHPDIDMWLYSFLDVAYSPDHDNLEPDVETKVLLLKMVELREHSRGPKVGN